VAWCRELPTVLECWAKLEEFDEVMSAAFESRDTRRFGRLEVNRRWWVDQLLEAQAREGYPRRDYDTSDRTRTAAQNSRS
jgi:hypothetical protein